MDQRALDHALSLAVYCVMLMAVPLAAFSESDSSKLVTELSRLERTYGGHLGVKALNLLTGEQVAYNATERFPTASVIKLPVMVAFFEQVWKKKLDPETKVVLRKEDKKPGLVLESMSDGLTMTLLDAVKLMIIFSDNTATNLVLDHLGGSHEARMEAVNSMLLEHGLATTRILNRLYTWETKKPTPEGIRYGIGVSTPEDMVKLLAALYNHAIADSATCEAMIEILNSQSDTYMMPRFLPAETCTSFSVAHKTGSINETKVDVGLVLSNRLKLALAIFVDKHPDHAYGPNNEGILLGAHVARAVWNYFTGDSGYYDRKVAADVDWNIVPGGKWAIYRSPAAPFPHPQRAAGFTARDGTVYPLFPHYTDNSITVFVPDRFKETTNGTNLIVHFHGHMNDNMGVLEQFMMPQTLVRAGTNAILVIPQGPYRARDSFGGKMEDEGGFNRLVEDVLQTMKREGVIASTKLNRIVVSAHSGGYRPAGFVLDRGGLNDHISDVFLFDAFYGQHEYFRDWLLGSSGRLFGAYTEHLKGEHVSFETDMQPRVHDRLQFTATTVDHNAVVQEFFGRWLSSLDTSWNTPP